MCRYPIGATKSLLFNRKSRELWYINQNLIEHIFESERKTLENKGANEVEMNITSQSEYDPSALTSTLHRARPGDI